jgi:hypothetical protein
VCVCVCVRCLLTAVGASRTRARRAKERIAVTELRKQANRVTFGVAEEEAFYGEESEGLGRLTGREQFTGSVRSATVDKRNKRTWADLACPRHPCTDTPRPQPH